MAKRPSLASVMGQSPAAPGDTPPPEQQVREPQEQQHEVTNRKMGKKRLGWVQFNTYIPSDLKTEAKIKAMREDVDLSDVVSDLLREWLRK